SGAATRKAETRTSRHFARKLVESVRVFIERTTSMVVDAYAISYAKTYASFVPTCSAPVSPMLGTTIQGGQALLHR
ncbi:MAG TPA: hypothetical protein VM715_18340, partial [Candidatus Acidoferrum sp.]|nr:hypothetical protein [Candidatus Acidoferrum sp.]